MSHPPAAPQSERDTPSPESADVARHDQDRCARLFARRRAEQVAATGLAGDRPRTGEHAGYGPDGPRARG